ncbi:MAG: UvrD-helicase domain-containing protein [Bdellovibrionales bacterium]
MSGPTFYPIKDTLVKAGAGAGKTTGLTHQVLEAAKYFREKNDGSLPSFVVTTFTVKATQELKERMLLKAMESGDSELVDFVNNKSQLFISTIHGVFTNFLRKFGYIIGLDSSFDILSEMENQKLFLKELQACVYEDSDFENLLSVYSFRQLHELAVQSFSDYIIYDDLAPYSQVELEQALFKSIDSLRADLKETVFELENSLNILEKESKSKENWILLTAEYKNLATGEFSNLSEFSRAVSQAVERVGRFPQNRNQSIVSAQLKDRTKYLWDKLKASLQEELIELENQSLFVECNIKLHHLLKAVSSRVFLEKTRDSKISMSDIESLSFKILNEQPEIAFAFSEDWDYWLIDEFQDTSPLQLGVLNQLIADRPRFVVGDPQQSIYLFRGADKNLFVEEEARIKRETASIGFLKKNFRSKPSTLVFINEFMSQFGFDSMEPKDEVSLGEESDVDFLVGEDLESENQMVGARISELVAQGIPAEEICVLARTNKALKQIARILDDREIPNFVHSSGSFFDQNEISDALIQLRFLANPYDDKNLLSLFRSPFFFIDDFSLVQLTNSKPKDSSFWAYFKNSEEHKDLFGRLSHFLDLSKQEGFVYAFERMLLSSGIFDSLLHYDSSGKREANLWKLVHQIKSMELAGKFNPVEYLRECESKMGASSEGESEAVASLEPNRVQLMTVHASKGLQFSYVFVVQMGAKSRLGRVPIHYVKEGKIQFYVPMGEEDKRVYGLEAREFNEEQKEKERQEALRVLYVALTRVKTKLFLSWNEAKAKSSWADLLDWKLTVGEHTTDNYRYRVLSEVKGAQWSKDSLAQDSESLTLLVDNQIEDKEEASSVSGILDERSEFGKKTKSSTESWEGKTQFWNKITSAHRGTQIHLLLELLKYHSMEQVSEIADVIVEQTDSNIIEMLNYVMDLDEPPMEALYKNAFLEWGFVLSTHNRTIEGQIDFWSEDEDTIWLVDFKTGSSKYKDKAFDQLKLYSLALYEHISDKPIQQAVIYLTEKKVFTQDAPTKLEIENDLFAKN